MKLPILLATILLSTALSACSTGGKARDFDRLMSAYHREGLFNGTVLVADGDRILFEKGYGYANAEWQQPNTPETRFRLASVTKQFAAMLTMQMVESGQLSVDDTISDHLPWYRKDIGEKVTIHHLMNHSSGIPNYTAFSGFYSTGPSRMSYRTREFVEKHCSNDLDFEPGERYSYCNSGYYILGAILEEVSGRSFAELLQERILEPAGMSHSGVDNHRELVPFRAAGYRLGRDGALTNQNFQDMSIYQAAGAMYSSARDMHRWHLALLNNTLVGEQYKELMFTPYLGNYGYGLGVGEDPSSTEESPVRRITHSGYYDGFNTYFTHFPETGQAIIILNNTGRTEIVQIRNNLADILFGREYEMPTGTRSIASASMSPVVSIARISTQGAIRDNDAVFNNGIDPAGSTIYAQGFMIYDGENAYGAGAPSGVARISDGRISETPTSLENRGMSFSATAALTADLSIQLVEPSQGRATLDMTWTLRNSGREPMDLRMLWFIDADLNTAGSSASFDRLALVDVPGTTWKGIAMTNDHDGSPASMRQGLLMRTDIAPAGLFGVVHGAGASRYWNSSNEFRETGPRPSGYRIHESLVNTVQLDENGDMISDEASDVAGILQVEFQIPARGHTSITFSVDWGPDLELGPK